MIMARLTCSTILFTIIIPALHAMKKKQDALHTHYAIRCAAGDVEREGWVGCGVGG